MTVCGGIHKLIHREAFLHPFGHFDAEEAHAVLDDLGHVLGYDEAHGLLLLVGLIEDRVVVIELVEHLRELIAVVVF